MTTQEFLEHLEQMNPNHVIEVTSQRDVALFVTVVDEDNVRWHVDLKRVS